jgi:hypothetical protein
MMHGSLMTPFAALLIILVSELGSTQVSGFTLRLPISTTRGSSASTRRFSSTDASSSAAPSKGFGKSNTVERDQQKDEQISSMSVKDRLVDLLPRMTGQEEEFRTVESYVNTLEDEYQPALTLDFSNLAMQGEWQLLFSTNLAGTPNPTKFRLRELIQRVECNQLEGSITNEATWDLAEEGDGNFDITGTFSVKCSYEINQGSRMLLTLDDHVLKPSRGSKIPQDVQALVGLLHRAMPKELFDPSEHSADTTYVDGNLRIVRYTGARLEGVRDIFIRRGALEVDPTATKN